MALGGFSKLHASILTSSIWGESSDTRIVWVTLLALSDAEGLVEGSIPGLARLAGVSLEACETALHAFLSPDPYSRTKTHEGRRLEPVDGGWLILNYPEHRARGDRDERREYLRKKKQESRDRVKQASAEAATPSSEPVMRPVAIEADPVDSQRRRKGDTKGDTKMGDKPRTHPGHVKGFCDWICFPKNLQAQYAAASGEDVSTPELRAEVEDRVRQWAQQVRAEWEGQQIGDSMWSFWAIRWKEFGGTTDKAVRGRDAWRAKGQYQREMR